MRGDPAAAGTTPTNATNTLRIVKSRLTTVPPKIDDASSPADWLDSAALPRRLASGHRPGRLDGAVLGGFGLLIGSGQELAIERVAQVRDGLDEFKAPPVARFVRQASGEIARRHRHAPCQVRSSRRLRSNSGDEIACRHRFNRVSPYSANSLRYWAVWTMAQTDHTRSATGR